MSTNIHKALAELSQRQKPNMTPGQTAADMLRGLPLANRPRRGDAPSPVMKTPTDPAAKRAVADDTPPWDTTGPVRKEPAVVRQVLEHNNEDSDSRLALRDHETGEFVSVEDARRDATNVVTDYVEKRSAPARKTPAKKATKKTAAKKTPAKKASVKKAASTKAVAKKSATKKAPAKKAAKK